MLALLLVWSGLGLFGTIGALGGLLLAALSCRVALGMLQAGYREVTATDFSPIMVSLARAVLAASGPAAPAVDFRALPGRFRSRRTG